MLQFGACPRCQVNMPEDRMNQNPIVCPNCGFSSPGLDIKLDQRLEGRFIKVAFGFAILVIAGFLQTASWDKFALSIIPLKIKQTLGMASEKDLVEIAAACTVRKKYDCVEQVYLDLAHRGHTEFWGDLGKFQVRRGNKNGAFESLKTYVAQDGADLDAIYQYAKLLGEKGQVEESANLFDQILKLKPDTLQISVTQAYVHMLINNGRNVQALALIKTIRKSSETASLFMEDEFKKLDQQSAQASR